MKLVKVTGYLIAEDDVNEADIETAAKEILSNSFGCVGKPFKAESVFLGETWDEDGNHILDKEPYEELNRVDYSFEKCEELFALKQVH